MTAREELYAAVMDGGYHSPARSERASARIDAFKAEVLAPIQGVLARWEGSDVLYGNFAKEIREALDAQLLAQRDRGNA